MATNDHHIFVITCLFLCLQIANCLRCYSCSSAREEFCDDTFSFHAQATVQVTSCEGSPVVPIPGVGPNTHCGKTKKKDANSPNDYVFRGCVPENYCRLVKSEMKECELCEHDKCNDSSSLLPTIYIGAMCLLTSFKI